MDGLQYVRTHYLEQPMEVSIETLALCNARCTFCPYPTLDRKGTRMDSEVVVRLIDEMARFPIPFSFSPFKVNEPFLDSRLLDFCQEFEARCRNGHLRLFTNGSALTFDKMTQVAKLQRVQHLWVSLNSHKADEYRELMGLEIGHVFKRLDLLHSLVVDGEFLHPVVVSKVTSVRRIVPNPLPDPRYETFQVNQAAIDDAEFYNFVRDRWPRFNVHFIKQDGWLGYVPPSSPEIPDTACVRWFELSILATGKVSLCCMDGKGDFCIGDIHQQTLLEIYNDPHYRARREAMISRRAVHPCSTCTY